MKILVLTNLFPPHHVGSIAVRCQWVVDALRLRGHDVHILTSQHGFKVGQLDGAIDRRLKLNGYLDHPHIHRWAELSKLEEENNAHLRNALERVDPDVVYVWSLEGISKSLIFTLWQWRRPVAYDISDHWLSAHLREDPWLRFWNRPSLPFRAATWRALLELTGGRSRWDQKAPTRMARGWNRIPAVYGASREIALAEPNSVAAFRFDRIYFCSAALKNLTERVGFRVSHAEVIHPGIPAEIFIGEVKPASQPVRRFLVVATLNRESGVRTALQALQILLQNKIDARLSIYGRGESAYIADLRSLVVTNQLPVDFLQVSNNPKDLVKIYQAHDALLHTAEWAEPFPVTPLEAMACGIPVIGARSGGAVELLRSGENALTYMPGDANELAARMQELQVQPALRVQMAQTAQEEVLTRFNQAQVIDHIEAFLDTSRQIWTEMIG